MTKDGLADAVIAAINRSVPGQDLTTNQPIAIRFGELLEGVHADVGVKVFGPDSERIDGIASQVRAVLKDLPGADETSLEAFGRTETLEVHPDAEAMRRFLVQGDEINHALEAACAGQSAGRVDRAAGFFPLVVRLSDADRANPALLEQLPVRAAGGTPLLALGKIICSTTPGSVRPRTNTVNAGTSSEACVALSDPTAAPQVGIKNIFCRRSDTNLDRQLPVARPVLMAARAG